jgi:DNA-binding HxlR family transcriptional regulator
LQLVFLEQAMNSQQRSGCPINMTMEELGDRWSLIIIRDMMFANRRHFRELLTQSIEGIASNVLAARLKQLSDLGFITRADDPTHKQKGIYSLTEKAIELVPVLVAIGAWGRRHLPVTDELSIRARLLEEGGPKMLEEFMDELRALHLGLKGKPASGRASVLQRLTEAYQEIARKRGRKPKQA